MEMKNEAKNVLLIKEILEQMNKIISPLRELNRTEKDEKVNLLYRDLVIGYDELAIIYNTRTSDVLVSIAN